MNNENLEQNTKSSNNKKLIIILIVLMIAIVSVGGIFTALSLKNKDNNKTEIKEENNTEVKEENKKEEVDKESNNQVVEEQVDEEPKLILMDDYFLNYELKLTAEDRIKLINDTNLKGWLDKLHGAAFKAPLSDEFKLYYTLSLYTYNIANNNAMEIYYDNLEITIPTIEKAVKNIFVDFKMPTNIDKNEMYKGLENLVCDDKKCNYTIGTAGVEGAFVNGYLTKPEVNGNVITVKPIYISYGTSENQNNPDELELDVTLYDTATFKEIKTIKNYVRKEGNTSEEFDANNYDALVGYYETLETYKYTFTDDFKLISVEKE